MSYIMLTLSIAYLRQLMTQCSVTEEELNSIEVIY